MTLAASQRGEATQAAGLVEGVPDCHAEVGCITCGDEGVEMRVLEVHVPTGLAVCVDGASSTSEVDLGIVADVAPGDMVLVHAGVALTRLEREGVA